MANYLLVRIEALQEELDRLRQAVLNQSQGEKRPTQLRELWHGVEFSDDDFAAARQAVFRDAFVVTAYFTDKPKQGGTLWQSE
jgi:hypothetical protein